MKIKIDPMKDCVFKAILGGCGQEKSLINFLNATLGFTGENAIQEAAILNPINQRETLKQKESVVDVKTRDGNGNVFQIEAQLQSPDWTPTRMVLTLCQTWAGQVLKGRAYKDVGAAYSIWLLRESI